MRLLDGPANEPIAVLAMDLDRFKAVNDLYGHAAGDAVLSLVAERIRNLLPKDGAVAARHGGDEFLILIQNRHASDRAARVGAALIEALAEPFVVDGQTMHVGASIGIAITAGEDRDFEKSCQNADRALYRAKESGRMRVCFFDPAMDETATRRRELEVDLRTAIRNKNIRVDYQPLVSLETGRAEGFEALARWEHPELGKIAPDTFIPVAEESGLIVSLGALVLETAISEAVRWDPPLRVAVNLSPAQFQDRNLVNVIGSLLERSGLDPQRLELEVTESFLIRDTAKAIAMLEELRSLGVRIAMDDFGTGYSSLSYFRMFPFDKVKIDRSFIQDMGESPQARAIVQAVVGLGRGLGLSVLAEGVESEEQVEALRQEGCTFVQGFHIGRPAPIKHFDGILISRSQVSAGRQSVGS